MDDAFQGHPFTQDLDLNSYADPLIGFGATKLGQDPSALQFWDQFLFDHQGIYNWADPSLTGNGLTQPDFVGSLAAGA